MRTCQACGGAIFALGEATGYTGPYCGCVYGRMPDPFQQVPYPQYSTLNYEDIKRAVREVLNELKSAEVLK